MGRAQMSRQRSDKETLSPEEFSAALNDLSPDDQLKLGAIETIKRGGTGFKPGELYYEAVSRTLLGDRNCPRDVPIMAYLVETMRSIASHDRERRKRDTSLEDDKPPERSVAQIQSGLTPGQMNPEEAIIHRENQDAIKAIYGHFDDDEEAQMVLMGWYYELRGAALREDTGLNQDQLDYAIKRIRLKMRTAYPNGWIR